jgi:hypothetical protein
LPALRPRFVAYLDRIFVAPLTQGFLLSLGFEVVPFLERPFPLQQIFESGVRASLAENPPDLVIIVRQPLLDKCEHQRFAQAEFVLMGYANVFFVVFDVFRQFLEVVAQFRMSIGFAGLLAQIGFGLVGHSEARELKRVHDIFEADGHPFFSAATSA